MADEIAVSLTVGIAGGVSFTENRSIPVDAYTINGKDYTFDQPFMVAGSSAKNLLPGGALVTKLSFKNNLDRPVTVDILVGRKFG